MFRLKLLDYFKRTNVNYWYKFYNSLLTLSRKEILAYQSKQLIALLNYSFHNVPYYKDAFNRLNITPQNFSSIEDLKRLPILDRNLIQQNLDDLISTKFDKDNLIKGSSSGTTGTPIIHYKCKNGYSAGTASAYILWGMSGWNPGDGMVHIWGNSSSVERWKTLQSILKTKFFNQLNIAATDLYTQDDIERVYYKIKKFKPQTIEGYVSSIYTLATFVQNSGLPFNKVKQVFTTAENLSSNQREVIEKHIGPTSDLYGSGEVLGVSIRPTFQEKYYNFDPHIVIETIDSEIKGMKHVLLTDLNNYGMPFIRYKIGDMIDNIYEPGINDKFQFSNFTKILGRSTDIIKLPSGKHLHPVSIFGGTLFRKYKSITRHKVVWDGTKLFFEFESKDTTINVNLKSELAILLKEYDVPFEIKYVNKIKPSSSGKYKYLEIKMDS